MAKVDVAVVGLDTTGGWRAAADALAGSIARAGATVARITVPPAPRVRTFALTDLTQAWSARAATLRAIAEHDPAAIVYCSVTAALLWPRPGAISLDSVAAENRPGRHGVWQRAVGRRRLAQAPLLLPWSERSLAQPASAHARAIVLPPPIEPPRAPLDGAGRELAAVTYGGDPDKRRLELVLDAWCRARRDGETLVVAGLDGFAPPPGVRSAGRLRHDEFRALLRRARVFVAAPRREDHGIAALEALAEGCVLVTTAAPGPYPALALARSLDPRLVGDGLARSLRLALDEPPPGYGERAAALLEPFAPGSFDRTVAGDVLPRLLPGWSARA
jgi:Glycosyl transferases group 1